MRGEGPVVPVVIALVFHQAGARQMIEPLGAGLAETALRLQQGQKLGDGDRYAGLLSRKKNLTSIPAVEKQQLLEQVHVLLVLQQRAVQRRNEPFASSLRSASANIFCHQQLDPIQEFGGGRLLLQARRLADLEERRQRLVQQFALQVRKCTSTICVIVSASGSDIVEKQRARRRPAAPFRCCS